MRNWKIWAAVIVLTLGVGGITMLLAQDSEDYKSGLRVDDVIVQMASGKKHTFHLEVAEKPIDLEIGLMYRRHMSADHGMIFLLGGTPHETKFWMKNTLIPLDMLFIGADGKIVNIAASAVPLSLTPVPSLAPVTAVIELNGGRAEAVGIKTGDRIEYSYFKP